MRHPAKSRGTPSGADQPSLAEWWEALSPILDHPALNRAPPSSSEEGKKSGVAQVATASVSWPWAFLASSLSIRSKSPRLGKH